MPKAKPAPEAPAKPTREESTAYLAGIVSSLLKGEKVGEKEYKLSVGYVDQRRGCLSQTGLNRFADVAEVKSLHDKAVAAYPAKAQAIMSEHKDILLKLFNAKPGQKSVTKEEYAKVAAVLEEPFSRTDEKGGLLYDAYVAVTEKKDPKGPRTPINASVKEIADAAARYREMVRVHVLSPLYLAGIYTRLNSGKTVAPDEKADLKAGITVFKDGKPVAEPFVEGNKLSRFGVEVVNNARRMLGGKKGETLDLAIAVHDSRVRKGQIAAPRAPKADQGPDLAD
jgi:hypothetical protein